MMDKSVLTSIVIWLLANLIMTSIGNADASSCGCPGGHATNYQRGSMTDNSRNRIAPRWSKKSVRIDDMLIPIEDFELAMSSETSRRHRRYRKQASPRDYMTCQRLWPEGKLYYRFASEYPERRRARVRHALSKLSSATDHIVKFIELNSTSKHVQYNVEVKAGEYCHSNVGTVSRDQELMLSDTCGAHQGVIQHEFMHALGFEHEQSRSDRDKYVRILWGNINSKSCNNFYKTTLLIPADYPGYDYESIMQYSSGAHQCDITKDTILADNGGTIQWRRVLSELDIAKIKYVYSAVNLAYCSGTANNYGN